MPNGGSDCCGTCWFNRANGGKPGSANHDRSIPDFCEIRDLEIEDPFYTYCANHPHHRPDRDPIPIGPVYVNEGVSITSSGGRVFWQPSPDTEEIRQHLLDIIRDPGQHGSRYPFYAAPPHMKAIEQLVEFGDRRVVDAMEILSERDEVQEHRERILELIQEVREELDEKPESGDS